MSIHCHRVDKLCNYTTVWSELYFETFNGKFTVSGLIDCDYEWAGHVFR